jgi:hypothetical protein
MTAIDKETMNLARKTAGEILYAQPRGEDIANVIARSVIEATKEATPPSPETNLRITEKGFAIDYSCGFSIDITARGLGRP